MPSAPSPRLAAAFAAVDAANAEDPARIVVDGVEKPYAVHYGERMSAWLDRLVPEASEPLRLSVRAQHIRRFDIPRSSHPLDKPGYHAWRNRLKDHHADLLAGIMAETGYAEDEIARARSIVRKERLKRDAEAQALEDCACLVFLENEFAGFAERHEDAKLVEILARTWPKMSAAGHALALAMAPALPERLRRLVETAVAGG